MFKTRVLSGIVLMVILLGFGYLGEIPLLLFCAVVSVIGLCEFYKALNISTQIAIIGYISTAMIYLDFLQKEIFETKPISSLLIKIIIIFFIYMGLYVIKFPKYKFTDIVWGFVSIVYIPVMISFFYATRELPNGIYFVWLIFITSWGSDTCAYCVGKLFGKHKLTPVLSPKKSIEGFIGGIIGSMLLCHAIYGIVFDSKLNITPQSLLVLILFTGLCSVISVIGDLTASAIKRENNIKDYGNIIPGHGGVMDRFDSVIFTAPIVYYGILMTQKYM